MNDITEPGDPADLEWWREYFEPMSCKVVAWTYRHHCHIELPSGRRLVVDKTILELLNLQKLSILTAGEPISDLVG